MNFPSATPARCSSDSGPRATRTKLDGESRKFFYDGENKQRKVATVGTSGLTVGEYWYDGDGRRIKKQVFTDGVPTGETIFVYDALGKLVAEYSNQVASQPGSKGGLPDGRPFSDRRGSTPTSIGKVAARHDYHPFGKGTASARRTSAVGYAVAWARMEEIFFIRAHWRYSRTRFFSSFVSVRVFRGLISSGRFAARLLFRGLVIRGRTVRRFLDGLFL